MNRRILRCIIEPLVTAVIAMLVGAAMAYAAPVKLVQTGHFPAGFTFAHGVAVNNDSASAEHGDIYVLDSGNSRVQVFSPAGVFVESFGKEVNTGSPKNICKAKETTCQAGVGGSETGQFSEPAGIAIDPLSGYVFVDERVSSTEGWRVQAFTSEGQFAFEIGKEVNPTSTQKNICTQVEIEKGTPCGAPKPSGGSSEAGAFNFSNNDPTLMAAGGPKDLLFVGDENRVQEFDATTGAPAGQEIALNSIE